MESEVQQAVQGEQQQPNRKMRQQEKSNSLGILIAQFHLVIRLGYAAYILEEFDTYWQIY